MLLSKVNIKICIGSSAPQEFLWDIKKIKFRFTDSFCVIIQSGHSLFRISVYTLNPTSNEGNIIFLVPFYCILVQKKD